MQDIKTRARNIDLDLTSNAFVFSQRSYLTQIMYIFKLELSTLSDLEQTTTLCYVILANLFY